MAEALVGLCKKKTKCDDLSKLKMETPEVAWNR